MTHETKLIAGIPHVRLQCYTCKLWAWTQAGAAILSQAERYTCEECRHRKPKHLQGRRRPAKHRVRGIG